MEVHEGSMLSAIASFTPFSDFNQSPRNMYQCQVDSVLVIFPSLPDPFRWANKQWVLQLMPYPLELIIRCINYRYELLRVL